jgi:4-methylaminobutanoate oxidase (formaldehyde-forming)
MAQDRKIVIVGGGIWGLSTAYHLAQLGQARVEVLEQNSDLALETTPRAAGLVGQIRSSPVMMHAIQYALELFTGMPQQTGHDPGLHRTGSLLVALSDERMRFYERQVRIANENGIDAAFVSHAEMQRLAPAMDVSQLKGGYFVAGDGYLDPRQCALAYAGCARDLGVKFRLQTRVTGLAIERNRVAGVETVQGRIAADGVIVTAGPWAGILAQSAGYSLPMQPIRHQRSRTVPMAGIPAHHPVVRVTDVSCYVRPEQGGYLYGFFEPNPTSIDLAGKPASFRTDDIPLPRDTMHEAKRRLAPIFPVLEGLKVAEDTCGMTTFAPDGRYLIGPVPDVEGLYVASGCAALGIAGSAAVGRWLAHLVLQGEQPAELTEFDLHRFGARAGDANWVRTASEEFYGGYYSIRP